MDRSGREEHLVGGRIDAQYAGKLLSRRHFLKSIWNYTKNIFAPDVIGKTSTNYKRVLSVKMLFSSIRIFIA